MTRSTMWERADGGHRWTIGPALGDGSLSPVVPAQPPASSASTAQQAIRGRTAHSLGAAGEWAMSTTLGRFSESADTVLARRRDAESVRDPEVRRPTDV